MSLFKRGSTYHYDFILDGVRQQGSTKLKNRRDAERLLDKIRAKLVDEGRGFVFEPPKPQLELSIPTFRRQSEVWLNHLQTRNRRPIPESSVPSIQGALNKWLWPTLGALPLSEVNHTALRVLVQKMSDAKLAPKTIGTYVHYAKQIVESLADNDGQPIVARKWDNDRIDLPVVNKREQRRATLTATQIEALIAVCDEPWEGMLYILACASGLRISEALALDR
jgi:integrase